MADERATAPQHRRERRRRRRRRGGGAFLSGSESEVANAMCRATDALIRETWPVLHRTRSLQGFPSPPDSPPFRSAPASFPTDGRGEARGGPLSTSAMAAEAGEVAEQELERGSRERSEDATAAMAMIAGFEPEKYGGGEGEGDGGGVRSRWEEEEQEQAVTTRGSSPVGYPSYPSSPSWKGEGDTGERVVSYSGSYSTSKYSYACSQYTSVIGSPAHAPLSALFLSHFPVCALTQTIRPDPRS